MVSLLVGMASSLEKYWRIHTPSSPLSHEPWLRKHSLHLLLVDRSTMIVFGRHHLLNPPSPWRTKKFKGVSSIVIDPERISHQIFDISIYTVITIMAMQIITVCVKGRLLRFPL